MIFINPILKSQIPLLADDDLASPVVVQPPSSKPFLPPMGSHLPESPIQFNQSLTEKERESLMEADAWSAGAASAMVSTTMSTSHVRMNKEHEDWPKIRKILGMEQQDAEKQGSEELTKEKEIALVITKKRLAPEAGASLTRVRSLQEELLIQRKDRESLEASITQAREELYKASPAKVWSGSAASSPRETKSPTSAYLIEAEQRRGELHTALMRESLSRVQGATAVAKDVTSENGLSVSARAELGRIVDPTLLEDSLTRHAISSLPQKDLDRGREASSRYGGQSAASYVKSMHADYYVDCNSNLDEAITSDKDRRLHNIQTQRLDPSQSAYIEALVDENANEHAPWSSSIEQRYRGEVPHNPVGALNVTRHAVEALSTQLKIESGEDMRPRVQPQQQIIEQPRDIGLSALEVARRRVESLNAEAQSGTSIREKLEAEKTIDWQVMGRGSQGASQWEAYASLKQENGERARLGLPPLSIEPKEPEVQKTTPPRPTFASPPSVPLPEPPTQNNEGVTQPAQGEDIESMKAELCRIQENALTMSKAERKHAKEEIRRLEEALKKKTTQ